MTLEPPHGRHPKLSLALKIGTITVGSLLILLGLVMLITPGPGWLAIIAGLAMLSPHSVWAKAILTWLKRKLGIRDKDKKEDQAAPAGGSRDDRRASM